ncbi:MAG TPA: hypothetical protein DCM05_14440 [Elusimicrobia bacterium]|nr:hypothetical protein [Elusimicrobiota bacterium]
MQALAICLSSFLWVMAFPALISPAQAPGPPPESSVVEANKLYFQGKHRQAAELYAQALKVDARILDAWLNGAIVYAELGEPTRAAEALRRAAELSPNDPEVRLALAEAEFRLDRFDSAIREAQAVLLSQPKDPYALIAKGRAQLALERASEAVDTFEKAAESAHDLTLAHYWLGRAREAAGDPKGALEAYRSAVQGDSYFTNARYQLSRSYLRSKRFYEAWKQVTHLLNVDPRSSKFRKMLSGVSQKAIDRTKPEPEERAKGNGKREPLEPPVPPKGRLPVLRVGLGTNALGKPLARRDLAFRCTTGFSVLDAATGRTLSTGRAGELWKARQAAGKKARIEILDEDGKRRVLAAKPVHIRPDAERGGTVVLRDIPADYGAAMKGGGDRPLRGMLELSLFGPKRGLKLVNVVDAESYTHGVLASEMPIGSPMEALKAQAVVARSHALYIKTVSRRHKKDGFDVCDGQHCQVYWGVRNETARSRAVVDATRGRVAAYQGRIAHVLYSSNCGGRSQSGKDLRGWGDVPYWIGITDAPSAVSSPSSPWDLRLWLRRPPPAYCRGSAYVHPSHFRWTRVITAEDLEERINRSKKVGRLQGILTLERSLSGHLNAVQIRGSKASVVISKELDIRGLLGDGSQRSALFTVETEFDRKGRPKLFTFFGGGWGHGVGMCQSGAMGRALDGQDYHDILAAYYPGIELGNLRY